MHKKYFSLILLLIFSFPIHAEEVACMQITDMKEHGTQEICFTIPTAPADITIRDCAADAFTSEFYSVSTEIIKSCPADEFGSCTYNQGNMTQINKYYNVSATEKESVPKFCEMYGGEWSQSQ